MYNDTYLIPEWRTAEKREIRQGIGDGLVELGAHHDDVLVLTADVAGNVRVRGFAQAYPDRFIDVGVAEQNLIGTAAGLAFTGYVPFTATYATFSPGRSWEQIRVSVALSQANVKIIGGHAGVATGLNGPSHQATEDFALMRILPHMTVLVPTDYEQARASVQAAYAQPGPVYIRSIRPSTANFTKPSTFTIGAAYVYREGRDATILACGSQVYDALVIAERLVSQGIELEVVNVSSLKPLDTETITRSIAKTKKAITIEDHLIVGGLGGLIAELVTATLPVPLLRLGVADRFGISAPPEAVYRAVGLDIETLERRISAFVR